MVQTNQSSGVNLAEGPEDLHKLFAQALNSGDLDALVALYALDGFLMARSVSAQGIGAIRQALAQYVAMKPTIQLTTHRIVQVGNTAVLSANWRFHGTATDGGDVSSSGTSIEVARREPDGSWRYLIDLPYGLG
jgi:ketosteroid isomerase-like protein